LDGLELFGTRAASSLLSAGGARSLVLWRAMW
jgi:hypothetical protein